jgi:hypothetical protein
VRAILAAMDAHLVLEVRWRAGELDRLLDAEHAALAAMVVRLLGKAAWELRVEVTYSIYGERGSIDVLAFMPATGTLLVIELKTDISAIEQTLRKLDEKVRLAPGIAKDRFAWRVRQVGWLLVMPENSTLRRKVSAHASIFDRALPARGGQVRRWIKRPSGALAGLWFLSGTAVGGAIRGGGGRPQAEIARTYRGGR